MKLTHVLLVDDSTEELELGTNIIEALDRLIAVHSVDNVQHAIQLLNGNWGNYDPINIDFVITDWMMPDDGGRRIVEHIRSKQNLELTPVVVLTASDHPRDVANAYRVGANTVVQKALTYESYQATLKSMLQYWTQLAQLPPSAH